VAMHRLSALRFPVFVFTYYVSVFGFVEASDSSHLFAMGVLCVCIYIYIYILYIYIYMYIYIYYIYIYVYDLYLCMCMHIYVTIYLSRQATSLTCLY